MFRKLLSSAALVAALAATPALAADLSYPVKAPPAMVVVPVFTWTGFYIGASAGYGWGSVDGYSSYDSINFDDPIGFVSSGDLDSDGWFGGFQAGYNYQFYNNVVVGVEADVFFADMSNTYKYSYSTFDNVVDNGVDVYGKYTAKIDAFGTIRARLGYAVDRFLPYITGGLAWANVKVSGKTVLDYDTATDGAVWSGSYSDTYWGWAIGAGAEYALTDNWTIKAEYIYADLGSSNFSGLFNKNDLDFDMQTLKVGVNYKF